MHSLQLPIFFAHRGASLLVPENTIPAFELAFAEGLTWIECDIQISSDEQLFIIHDESLERTTNGQGLVHQTSALALSKLDAGSWLSANFAGTSIPPLGLLFTLLSAYQTHANLELKAVDDPAINQRTAQLLAEALPALRKKAPTSEIIVSSFDPESLITFAKLSPHTPLALLLDLSSVQNFEQESRRIQSLLKKLPQIVSLNINDLHLYHAKQPLSERCLLQWKKLHPTLCVYTINDVARAIWLIQKGISGIFTDDIHIPNMTQVYRSNE